MRVLQFALLISLVAHAATISGPSSFYMVSSFFSDRGPSFYYRVIEVTPDGADTLVRYSRIADATIYCPRKIVESAQRRVRNTSPATLVKNNNLFALKPDALRAALRQPARQIGVFETISVGISAQCGAEEVILELPIPEKVDRERLRREHPEMDRLWKLSSQIIDPLFGSKDIFHDRTDDDEMSLQRAGETLEPELISGRYDAALAAAVHGNIGDWKTPSFRSLLETYRGPVNPKEAIFTPKLVNAESYDFAQFVAPKYPQFAMMARIQAKVELKLTIDQTSGMF
jgi:hypothetical protein